MGSNDGALHAFALEDWSPAVGPGVTAGEEVDCIGAQHLLTHDLGPVAALWSVPALKIFW